MARLVSSLLIPTDGSDGAVAGAKLGIALASRLGAVVHAVSVVDVDREPESPAEREAVTRLQDEAEQSVEAIASMARSFDPSIEVVSEIRRGTPFQHIREYATRREIDMITMGTKGRSGLDRVLLGSVTENVLRTARKPVLVVPPGADVATIEDETFERFVLPTDGSDGARIAIVWGIALASELEAEIHAVHAVNANRVGSEAFRERREREGERALAHLRERAQAAGVSASSSLEPGPPERVILRIAAEFDADLIVMGTHGRTGIGQWFLGSVTENVVRQATVPILCVPVSAPAPP